MLRLIPGTVFRMFGARYSKIILRYPFFVTLFIFLAPHPGGKWSCLPILPQNSFENYLSDSAVYSQSFYSPVSFLPGILLSCLEKIRPLFERSSVASLRLARLSGNSGVSFASPRTVFSGTILPRTIFFSIVVVVPVYLACVLYPASKITIIIINKCPDSLGLVSKFCTGSAQYSSQFRCCKFVPYVNSVTVSNYDTF